MVQLADFFNGRSTKIVVWVWEGLYTWKFPGTPDHFFFIIHHSQNHISKMSIFSKFRFKIYLFFN